MKLFSPTQVKEIKDRQTYNEIQKLRKLETAIHEKNKELAAINPDLEKRRVSQEYEAMFSELESKRSKLLADIDVLQTKRRTLSTPLTTWEQELTAREENLRAQQLAVKSTQLDIDKLKQSATSTESESLQIQQELKTKQTQLSAFESDLKNQKTIYDAAQVDLVKKRLETDELKQSLEIEYQRKLTALQHQQESTEGLRKDLQKELIQIEKTRQKKLKAADDELFNAIKLAKSTDVQRQALEANKAHIAQLQTDIERLKDTLSTKDAELNNRLTDIEVKEASLARDFHRLAIMKDDLVAATNSHLKRRDDLQKEVVSLEKRQQDALRPVEEVIKQVRADAQQLKERETFLQAELARLTTERQTLKTYEADLEHKHSILASREDDLKTQLEITLNSQQSLKVAEETFEAQKAQTLEDIRLKTQALTFKESDLESQVKAYNTLLNELDAQRKVIELDRLKLKDERATLDSAWAELRNKH